MTTDQKITGNQLSAARMLAEISQKQLANKSNVSIPTIKRMEGVKGEFISMTSNSLAVVEVLNAAGITFVDDSSVSAAGGPGVRLSTSPKPVDVMESEVVQYPEYLEPDASTGAGG